MSISNYLRGPLALAIALSASAVFAQAVTVVEFYNKTLDAYFITGRVTEQLLLDGQTDFRRTGMTFDAVTAAGTASNNTRICRFYINLASPPTSSHFYGREGVDCEQIQAQNVAGFSYEGFDFAVAQPQGGVCPAGAKTVYRGFRASSGGKTSNHRYTTSLDTYSSAQSQGYVGEGAAFCATGSTDVALTVDSAEKCGTFYYPAHRISYQSLNSEGAADSFSSFLSTTTTTFDEARGVTPLVERFQVAPTFSTMIIDAASAWTVLGTTTLDNGVLDEVYYTNPTVYPRTLAIGQVVNINRQLTYLRTNTLGNATQVGKVTFIGKESVTVPLGTFPSACKFATELLTTYSGTGQTITVLSTHWAAHALGIVKTISDVKTASTTSPTAQVTTITEAFFDQPY